MNQVNAEEKHTEEIQDIISVPPLWLLRWGITCVFVVLISIVCVSAFISYPEIQRARLRITSINPPQPIFSAAPGSLIKLLVKNNQYINANQKLAYISSSGNYEQILQVSDDCEKLGKILSSSGALIGVQFPNPDSLQIGDLQIPYQRLYESYHSISGKDNRAETGFRLKSLETAIDSWKSKHVLSAPRAGQVLFAGIVEEGMQIRTGQPAFYVSDDASHLFGEIYIPQGNMGKVKRGQKVMIKLDSYPYEEFGIVKGTLSYISDIAVKGDFIGKVVFDTDKFSMAQKPITLKFGMVANAEIITDDMSVAKRMMNNLFKVFY